MIKWGRGAYVFLPNKWDDDGTISKEYLAWADYEQNKDTYEEQRREERRDAEMSEEAGNE